VENTQYAWTKEAGSTHLVEIVSHILTTIGYGQLGTGKTEDSYFPTMIKKMTEVITSVSAGGDHSLISTKMGNVYAAGRNDQGQLGTGDRRSTTVFTLLKDMDHISVIKVEAGHQHSACISSNRELYIWGTECFGEFLIPHLVKTIKGR